MLCFDNMDHKTPYSNGAATHRHTMMGGVRIIVEYVPATPTEAPIYAIITAIPGEAPKAEAVRTLKACNELLSRVEASVTDKFTRPETVATEWWNR